MSRQERPENPAEAQPFHTLAHRIEKTPPCQAGCPNSGDIRGWLGLIAQREKMGISLDEAYDRAWAKLVERNPFPATLGRICPHPCETRCSRNESDGAVSINAMERFLGDWGISRRLPLPRPAEVRRSDSIGVIGSGPAGLSFAYQMAMRGYAVTVYERLEVPGGMLRHAIPDYRLPREVLDAEIQRLLDLPVEIVRGVEVGQHVTLGELRARHRLLFLGMGAQAGRMLGVPGETGPGVMAGIEYLKQRKNGIAVELGERVIVVGGGNTAIDAARSARRDGAYVTLLYRRTRTEMPAAANEVKDAMAEGIRFEFLAAPARILRRDGFVTGVQVQRMQLGEVDADGRQRAIPVPGELFLLESDTVLAAVSQEPDWHGIAEAGDAQDWLQTTDAGELADDLWAGGDDRGPGIASRAIAQGRLAAEAAHARMQGEAPPQPLRRSIDPSDVRHDYYEPKARSTVPRRPLQEWLSQPEAEIDQTLTPEQAALEASRCMSCGLCFGCQQCFMYCNASGFTRIEEPEPGRYYAMALEACEGCGKCVELCPCGFLETRDGAGW